MTSDVNTTGKRLQITRILHAPRPMVFRFWAEPEKLQRWSGCKEATNCQIQMDFRVGGSFTQKMQIADKGEFTFTGIYDEIVEPERISYRAFIGPATTRVLVEFFDEGEQTRVVLIQTGFPDDFSCHTVLQGTMESFE